MNMTKTSKKSVYVAFAVVVCLSVSLLFPGLDQFGMWEPHETKRAEVARAILAHDSLPANTALPLQIEERLVAWTWSFTAPSDIAARVPLAVLALFSVAAMFLLLLPIAGHRVAFYAAVALASAPILLFHGRQLTSYMPLLLSEVLAVGGLALAAWGPGKKSAAAGVVAAGLGMALGWLSSGVLIGVFIPCFTVFVALAVNGDVRAMFGAEGDPPPVFRHGVIVGSGVLSILALGAFFSIVLFSNGDVDLITGGAGSTLLKHKSFDVVLERLAFGWFPWFAFVPVIALDLFRTEPKEDPKRRLLVLSLSGLIVGCVVHVLFLNLHGISAYFLAFPIGVGVALGISAMEKPTHPALLGALIVLALLVIMIRDFAQDPATLLMGYGFENIPLPKKDFELVIPAAIASAPVLALVLLLGFAGRYFEDRPGWRALRVPILVLLCAGCFGGYVSHVLVPGLSQHLSSKAVVDSYRRFRKAHEPIGVYGKDIRLEEAKRLGNPDVVDWLMKEERVFVVFPKRQLVVFNQKYRKRTGRHISILDAASNKFILATSRLLKGEKNQNPLAPFIQNKPFVPGPSRPAEVNFDNKVVLIGWDIKNTEGEAILNRGKKFTVTTYWRCDDVLKINNKIFMHIDGPGGRLHGDHEPLGGLYPTRKWSKGEYIKDVHTLSVPLYQKAGTYSIRMGLYRGAKRVEIIGHAKAEENSVWIGEVEVK